MSAARIQFPEHHCRYLTDPGGEARYSFGTLLDDLGLSLKLSPDLLPRELVARGWIEPAMRIELPERFLLSWQDYPSLSFSGDFDEADLWANRLWLIGATGPPAWGDLPSSRSTWYHHFLDDSQSTDRQAVLDHRLPTDGSGTPSPISHPNRPYPVHRFIDLYGYWQAYHVAEILGSIKVDSYIRLPDARERLEVLIRDFDELEQMARSRVDRLKKRWLDHQPTFDWISRYRTLVGIWRKRYEWHRPVGGWAEVEDAARQLLAELGMEPADLRHQIRDNLLTLWNDWSPEGPSKNVRLLLQNDIAVAVRALQTVTGEDVKIDDEFWCPGDRMQRRWATLPEALPLEAFKTQREFPRNVFAEIHNSKYHQLVPPGLRLDEDRLTTLTENWWPHSVALRRLALALKRLTDHSFGKINKERLVELDEETPVEFLVLCALHVEKLLGELLGPSPPRGFYDRLY